MEIPRHWRLKKQRYGLIGEVCPHCDHKIFPPRGVCPNCGGEVKVTHEIGTHTAVYNDVARKAPIAAILEQPVAA